VGTGREEGGVSEDFFGKMAANEDRLVAERAYRDFREADEAANGPWPRPAWRSWRGNAPTS
jgi:hypothetical protein